MCLGKLWYMHCPDNKAAVVKVLLAQLQLLRDGCREAEEMEAEGGRGEDWGEVEGGVSGLCEDVRGVQLGGGGEECEGPREWTDREKQLVVPYIQLVKVTTKIYLPYCLLHHLPFSLLLPLPFSLLLSLSLSLSVMW